MNCLYLSRYTLWNAEYRISLMRNFDISPDTTRMSEFPVNYGVSEVKQERVCEAGEGGGGGGGVEDLEKLNIHNLGDLSPEATDHIQQLELELSTLKQVRITSFAFPFCLEKFDRTT